MSKAGPIILVDDDLEDQILFREALIALKVTLSLITFNDGTEALAYLQTTSDKPFIIFCDINMPRMNGFQLRNEINGNSFLRKKSIPFLFFSTSANREDVERAYDLTVQGYFKKTHSFQHFLKTLECIISYWQECKHPNSLP